MFAERTAHRETAVEALLAHANALSEDGAFLAAIAAARKLLAFDPLYEEGHLLLINLLNNVGRFAAARRQYAFCEELLREGLGVMPAKETRDAAFPPGTISPVLRMDNKPVVAVRRMRCLGGTESAVCFIAWPVRRPRH